MTTRNDSGSGANRAPSNQSSGAAPKPQRTPTRFLPPPLVASVRSPMPGFLKLRRFGYAIAILLTLSVGTLRLDAAVRAVGPLVIPVADLDRAVSFYRDVLSFEQTAASEETGGEIEAVTGVFAARVRSAEMRLGSEGVTLVEFMTPAGAPVPHDSRSNDLWFQHAAIVVSDMERAYAHLHAAGVRHASPSPQTLPEWNANAAGIKAFYFRDPDGHFLEVIYFPRGKGDPRWQQGGDRLFLGIDHTAIVVSGTERGLAFYRDTLGMSVAGGSVNHGIEQERLNAVFGAHLRITTLKAAHGPGVEFLEYLTPAGGRPLQAGAAINDLVAWRTTLAVEDIAALVPRIRAAGGSIVSSIPQPGGTRVHRVIVRDPDGHALELVGPN